MDHALESISWPQAQSRLREVTTGLASELVSALTPVATHLKNRVPLFLARYPYGELLVEKGQMRAPSATQSADLKREFERATSYCCIPLTVVMRNSVEVFTHGLPNRIISLRVLGPGEPFGVFEVLDALTKHSSTGTQEKPPWSVSSGARSIHLIGAIDEAGLQKRMSTCLEVDSADLDWDLYKKDSWPLIRRVAQKKEPGWHTEVLVLPKPWLIPDSETPRYNPVHRLLFNCGWSQSESLRNAALGEADLADQISAAVKSTRRVKLDSFDAFLAVRQLLATARGQAVAFEPVTTGSDGLNTGPFLACQDFLLEHHKELDEGSIFTNHFPIILHPCHLTAHGQAGFYSLSKPSALAVIPRVPIGDKGGHRSWTDFLKAAAGLLININSVQPELLRPVNWEKLALYGQFAEPPPDASKRRQRSEVKENFPLPDDCDALEVNFKHAFFTACVKVVRT